MYDGAFLVQDAASLVGEAAADGDLGAERILKKQAAELARQVAWIVDQRASVRPRLALLGA